VLINVFSKVFDSLKELFRDWEEIKFRHELVQGHFIVLDDRSPSFLRCIIDIDLIGSGYMTNDGWEVWLAIGRYESQ